MVHETEEQTYDVSRAEVMSSSLAASQGRRQSQHRWPFALAMTWTWFTILLCPSRHTGLLHDPPPAFPGPVLSFLLVLSGIFGSGTSHHHVKKADRSPA
uniref:Uncharacterized protein n=1 Tax=Rhipicephalus zambeziensis TaxID=60191 RepID=A0A224YHM0_9ACAR